MKSLLSIIAITLCTLTASQAQKKELVAGVNAHYQIDVKTSEGKFSLQLFNDTPKHRDNFVKLCNEGFYEHIIFHRVINEFMIQCGDPKSIEGLATVTYGDNDAGYKIEQEIKPQYFHKKGMLAAAREPDVENPKRESSGSHFYIVVGKVHNDSTLNVARKRLEKSNGAEITPQRELIYKTIGGTPHLDGGYTIFGEIISGQKTVDNISIVKTHKSNDRPHKDIYIKSCEVKLVEDKTK